VPAPQQPQHANAGQAVIVTIRTVERADAGTWLELRCALWPDDSAEFASDTEPHNDISSAAHRALGFADVGLVHCFGKEL